ncbi:hypothetical protein HNQ69_000952 [Bartonella callosciuri]|uniref:Uncharacterized protein n=1 Tax=Bartonella callosciuri TaxID=686223 RepID=A0A840NMB6_9HYPH|nr:hypothetical protein [Bartonella callosciuri]
MLSMNGKKDTGVHAGIPLQKTGKHKIIRAIKSKKEKAFLFLLKTLELL